MLRIIIGITGILWLFYGAMFLALASSISSLPEKISGVKPGLQILAAFSVVCSALLMVTAFYIKKNKLRRRVSSSLVTLLRYGGLSTSINKLSAKCGLDIRETQYFVYLMIKHYRGMIAITDKGTISFKYIKRHSSQK